MKICLSLHFTYHYKVDNKKEKLEDFKTAISSTVRSISNSKKIEISFGNKMSDSDTYTIKLPELVKQVII